MRLAASLILTAALLTAQSRLDQVRAHVLENAKRAPRYTCVETINRAEYRPQYSAVGDGCRALIAARDELKLPGYLTWHDRLRLDVAVLDGKETFSWAGARQFETTDIQQLVSSGSAGSGDFASFLATVFGAKGVEISFLGGDVFSFEVPLASSGYRYRRRGTGPEATTGYHGTFSVENTDIKQLIVDADRFPQDEPVCRVRDVMDYARAEFTMPVRSSMTVLFTSGKESRNETTYANCREYKGESTIRFDAPENEAPEVKVTPRKLPSRVKLQIGLNEQIDSDTAAAGDPVTGVVLRDAKGIKAGTLIEGRIVMLQQFLFRTPRWMVGFEFEGLRPLKRSFTFNERGKLLLDPHFRSDWETR